MANPNRLEATKGTRTNGHGASSAGTVPVGARHAVPLPHLEADEDEASPSYYRHTARAFDALAATYDQRYRQGDDPIRGWLALKSLATLRRQLPRDQPLLEIGCGTGTEALALAADGREVTASDISSNMLAAATTKARDAGLDGHLTFHCLPASEIGGLTAKYGTGAFGGAYSSFGALNCEPRLDLVATGLHALLERDALFVTSVVNRWCAFEIVWHLLHGDLRVALRRVGGTWTGASLDGDDGEVQVSARCYTPRSLAQLLGPFFRLEQVLGLGVFVPPPYLSQLAGAHPGPFRALESLEGWCADAFPFSWSGDHFTAIFRRCDV